MTSSVTTHARQITALVLLAGALSVVAAAAARDVEARQAPQPRVVEVLATRFTFQPSEIDAVEGEPLRIVLRSGDGLHGFEIRDLRISREVPRGGEPVVIEFTPTQAGRFPILCSVYCGEGHNDMRGALVVRARGEAGVQGTAAAVQAGPVEDDPDLDLSVEQPDFSLLTLPTTLRLPQFKSAFRVTHRFTRSLNDDFGDLLGDLFGLDSSALIGLEYRFGLLSGLQAGIYRTSNKTIEFFGQYNLLQQSEGIPLGVGILASVEGTNNFRDVYSPALGVAVSRTLAGIGALYAEPIWVRDTNAGLVPTSSDDDTLMLGLGARIRVRPTVYLVGEIVPRLAGFDPGVTYGALGIEKRAGGHIFQLNVSNGFGTTIAQTARGGLNNDDWYLGFNISRKFF